MKLKEIKIFISFARDAERECNLLKRIITEETNNHFSKNGYRFTPLCWKDIPPGLGHSQKDKIDPVIFDCKLVIIILKNRLGREYENGKTNIEHEYELAKSLQKEVWIYDCDFKLNERRSKIEPQQIMAVNDFIQKVEQEGLIRRILDSDELSKYFRADFSEWANQLIMNDSNLSKLEDFSKYNRGF